MCPSSKRRYLRFHFTVLAAFKCVHPAREEDDGPNSLCLEPSNDHVIWGPKRGLERFKKKKHGEGSWWTSSATRQTLWLLQQIGRVGRFRENLVGFWWKCQLPDSLKIFLIWWPFRRTIEKFKCVKKGISIMLKLLIVRTKKSEFSLRTFQKGWTLVFDGSDNFQISEKFVNNP